MSAEIITIFLGASPVLELRGAIPFAVVHYHFPIYKALLLGIFGNMLPVIPFLYFLREFSEYLSHKFYFFNRFMNWLFERFQKKQKSNFEDWDWKLLALFIFVAIPFPFTGAWSGVIAAYILGLPFWKSVFAIFLGILCSGMIVASVMYLGALGINFVF
ncbi:MAG: hypothetical protein A2402_00875 [Candidatus Staskawiczbacteria bacterium RIFOXYC1_FULL_37_43]|nr:MAG: hypothetical protein A2813_00625 [Candidatus Staskawiczbacteria bacterium RIFCSPHIGHO2_01_FULL_37_17]OGZ71432.1 MAG: hypothetical protein A2891_00785 [Candidatus Staskawiczbacteria bacterium RIFCSPLOWO2_01_FULL_37_19]OGZ76173.1 MAG: hypothetical protein A2205_03950 [Candidatus Staskawiczbacteria bacterium RIFOXYA1_FULL_37_15]OGZ77039.1 MAG: hypothetical protein A2280_00950 [Candidatus Staskawiczbacteria bacterium RIFOXYA12_FULL_37_10]OGZ80142.1 MAG: hypothetical protein A2353_02665 [Can